MTAQSTTPKRPNARGVPRLTARDQVWTALRNLARGGERVFVAMRWFTAAEVADAARVKLEIAQTFLRDLTRAEVLLCEPAERVGAAARYFLKRDLGSETPAFKQGVLIERKAGGQERLWLAMAPLSGFSAAELVAACGGAVKESTAEAYVRALYGAGYLALLEPALMKGPNNARRPARYRLKASHNTGPKPPAIRQGANETGRRRKRVYDPNVGREIGPGERP
jgi:hypothetical protein